LYEAHQGVNEGRDDWAEVLAYLGVKGAKPLLGVLGGPPQEKKKKIRIINVSSSSKRSKG